MKVALLKPDTFFILHCGKQAMIVRDKVGMRDHTKLRASELTVDK